MKRLDIAEVFTDLTEDLIARGQLDQAPADDDSPAPDGPISIDAIRANILRELNARLADPKQARELPGTTLMQLAKELLKQAAPAADDGPAIVPDVLDLIDHPGLPADRKRVLVEQEIRVAENRLDQCRQILEALDGDDDGEALPEVPPLLHETRW